MKTLLIRDVPDEVHESLITEADTTFLSDLLKERRRNKPGPATALLMKHRAGVIRTTIISAGEAGRDV